MDFSQVSEVLAPFPELESASFVHGMLVGLMCGDSEIKETVWIKKLIEEADIKSVKESFLQVLHQLYLETDAGLNGSGFDFALCIPDDTEALGFRASMLGQWAEGYLYGMGLLGKSEKDMAREVTEFLGDLGDIAGIDAAGLSEPGDEEEADFMEISEFVRMGVLMVNEELNPTQAAPIMDAECPTDTLQ